MTPQVLCCAESDSLEAAVDLMRSHAVRRLVVMDAAERLAGLLSVDDVALRSPALAGEILEHALAPDRPVVPRTWPWW
jgi:CBS domain-containing protein